ncbi:MAG TPA: 4-hydroxybutyrate dehydrogenase [Clostridium sp.]|uniref:4-hydroxybutyrate dehydrogenase n=1 Tax=Clostridium sp. TaxID=1506 RepID=UPI002F934086
MKNFQLIPQIYSFDNFKDFVEEFKVGDGDLVLTHKFIYEPFMKELNIKSEFIFQEEYGFGEPTDEMINKIISDIPNKKINRIIGIGGGTVIDIAKLMIFKDVVDCLDLFEKRIPLIRDKSLIIVPTTCGTGSEVTNISIAEIKSKHTKMGLASDELFANQAVLIPELMKGLPFKFFVASSIDALIHAIEAFVSPKSNAYTELFSIRAIEMIIKGYIEIIEKGEEQRLALLKKFSTASNYAGIAFVNAGVGAVHAMSYPLGGVYHVAHGEANYHLFTEVFKMYNKKNPSGKIKEINSILTNILNLSDGEDVYKEIENVLNKLLMKRPLKEFGMKLEEIELFTDSVIEKQQRLLVNNYVQLSREEMIEIYKNLY